MLAAVRSPIASHTLHGAGGLVSRKHYTEAELHIVARRSPPSATHGLGLLWLVCSLKVRCDSDKQKSLRAGSSHHHHHQREDGRNCPYHARTLIEFKLRTRYVINNPY